MYKNAYWHSLSSHTIKAMYSFPIYHVASQTGTLTVMVAGHWRTKIVETGSIAKEERRHVCTYSSLQEQLCVLFIHDVV
jgi:hypothetical protein